MQKEREINIREKNLRDGCACIRESVGESGGGDDEMKIFVTVVVQEMFH